MVYDAEKLIADCAASAQGRAKGVSKDVYSKVWGDLQGHLSQQMGSQKGVNIPSFGEFCFVRDSDRKHLKPEFKVSSSFSRSHHLSRKLSGPEASPVEALNFRQIAKGLPQDQVQVATRQLLSQLGTAIDSGKDVQLNFGVGTLRAKSRAVDFAFDPRLHSSYKPPTPAPTVPSLALGSEGLSRGATAPRQGASSRGAPSPAASSISGGYGTGTKRWEYQPGLTGRATPPDLFVPGAKPPVNDKSKDLKAPHMFQVKDAATELAYQRFLYQKRDQEAFDRSTEVNMKMRKATLDQQARLIKDRKKVEAQELASFLRTQMDARKAADKEAREEAKKPRAPSRLPTPQQMVLQEKQRARERMATYRTELMEQMTEKAGRKKAAQLEAVLDSRDNQAAVEEDMMYEHAARQHHKELVKEVLNVQWSEQVAEKKERQAREQVESRVPTRGLLTDKQAGPKRPMGKKIMAQRR
mmetsp:Transcript_29412/g.94159  ORF Transcript_29412/g.94159 Transcript_29412/m.94159 type:complete len:468 (+) Transcript_29412:248-1651(+)